MYLMFSHRKLHVFFSFNPTQISTLPGPDLPKSGSILAVLKRRGRLREERESVGEIKEEGKNI